MVVAGALLLVTGMSSKQQAPFTIGFTLIPFGISGILTYLGTPARPVLTIAGIITLVFWLLPEDLFSSIFGEYSGDIEMFFVSGICIVAASTLVIVQNLDTILSVVEKIGGRIKGFLPATRLAVSYPGASKSRTGMTIAMFSLIVFSLVMVAAINTNFAAAFLNDDAYAGWDVQVNVGRENPIEDFGAELQSSGVDIDQIAAIGTVTLPNEGGTRFIDSKGELATIDTSTADATWFDTSNLTFQARAGDYDSDEAILEALKTEPDVMVIPATLAEGAPADFGPPISTIAGTVQEGTFNAPTVQLDTGDGQPHAVRVIGVLDDKYSMLFGAWMGEPTSENVFSNGSAVATSYYLQTAAGTHPSDLARDVEVKLLPFGAVATDLDQQMKDDQATSSRSCTSCRDYGPRPDRRDRGSGSNRLSGRG
jgi:putative ABC transport system permease protein